MIANLSGSTEMFLTDLDRTQQSLERAQRQMSSGRKVNSVADAPEEVAGIVQLRVAIDVSAAAEGQLENTKAMVDAADQAVQTGVQLMDRAAVLAEQAASSLQTADSRTASAQEIQGILEQMVALSRTEVAGRYVFSGDSDQSPSYVVDSTSSTGVNRLLVPRSSLQIADAGGSTVSFSRTAQEIFDHRNSDDTPAGDNVFGALNSLWTALRQNGTSALQTSLSAVRTAGDYLNSQLGFYGAVQNRMNTAIDISKKFQVQQKAYLSQRQDADLAAAALELSQAQIQQQASLSAQAKVPKTSLFDYLG